MRHTFFSLSMYHMNIYQVGTANLLVYMKGNSSTSGYNLPLKCVVSPVYNLSSVGNYVSSEEVMQTPNPLNQSWGFFQFQWALNLPRLNEKQIHSSSKVQHCCKPLNYHPRFHITLQCCRGLEPQHQTQLIRIILP